MIDRIPIESPGQFKAAMNFLLSSTAEKKPPSNPGKVKPTTPPPPTNATALDDKGKQKM